MHNTRVSLSLSAVSGSTKTRGGGDPDPKDPPSYIRPCHSSRSSFHLDFTIDFSGQLGPAHQSTHLLHSYLIPPWPCLLVLVCLTITPVPLHLSLDYLSNTSVGRFFITFHSLSIPIAAPSTAVFMFFSQLNLYIWLTGKVCTS